MEKLINIYKDQIDEFAAMLKELRLEAGMTQAELAEKAGVSPRGIRRLEAGSYYPSRRTVTGLDRALKN